ncbi:MAG TPA: DCC1-like thiol-disulfide oxidoreductase family protein [Thermoanaerobaculia bacterium]|jgi:predicted DCC family thiol-disulfide oxidoreductase YuxK|nr:DCC1-like thiol-disulfide oxidoreductase family protein [Thermoanaerobaculia bacterium]
MKNAWTGGQYSIVRAIVGLCLFVFFLSRLDVTSVFAIAAVFFALGWFDRIAAIVLWCGLAWLHRSPALMLQSSPLLIHAWLPPAPFLSIAARGRVDPRGNWSFPPVLFVISWITVALGWMAMFVTPGGFHPMSICFLPFLFAPGWVPRRAPETTDEVFYDGTCGLCHKGMRWLVAEDPTGTSFRYAPLGGDAFAAAFPDSTDLPDSVIVKTANGAVLVRSDAAVHLLGRLGGFWRIDGMLFGLLPRRMRDAMYDFVARVRYRIFGRTKDACPLMPPDLRSRFTI